MIENNWQLAVIDYDFGINAIKRTNAGLAADLQKSIKTNCTRYLPDGTIVYVVAVNCEEYHGDSQIYHGLVRIADVYVPDTECYDTIWCAFVHPILTEKDMIDVELRLGISLSGYVKEV